MKIRTPNLEGTKNIIENKSSIVFTMSVIYVVCSKAFLKERRDVGI